MALTGMSYNYTSLTGPIFRTDSAGYMAEPVGCSKRQVFLRSYQFSRKRSLSERIRRSLVRVKRLFWFRLRSARKLRRVVWAKLSKLRQGFYGRRRPSRFLRLVNGNHYYYRSNCDGFPCFC
ncbi:uncharacterized protein LOC116209906 [Punica granatum]|uniref:Uncharacterized protein LOC116209906 n=2 Tax=Punica granatum TaxID=22663 RepID=A0A6P8DYX7_PUNGR|nr:uncharacterized protein LOC116209906 [Punica granatum]XP_031399520.1 uncharacterized protein LOC116209906 [Punica granatum]OWM86104.1 hypothetical protein CDL15_Pgr010928 [Punica granatum]PKI53420.1 hypothetical protein CRG98_026209 [Punica granatum]